MQRALPWILEALPRLGGTHDLPDIIQLIMNGDVWLWISDKSFILTEVIQYPKLKELNFLLAGGDMDDLLEFDDILTDYAKTEGCARIQSYGRLGFSRNRGMKALGYRQHQIVMQKDLSHG